MIGRRKKKEEPVSSMEPSMDIPMDQGFEEDTDDEDEEEYETPRKKRTPKPLPKMPTPKRTFYETKMSCENCERENLLRIPVGVTKVNFVIKSKPICKLCRNLVITIPQTQEPVEQVEEDYE